MRILTIARGAALVALFAALPAPASAQLGFIKKQLKQKIVHEVVDSAISRVAGQGSDSAQSATAGTPTASAPQGDASAASLGSATSAVGGFLKKRLGHKLPGAPADSPRTGGARPSAPQSGGTPPPTAGGAHGANAVSGPQFDQLVIEITPQSLDGLQKFLATQTARRDDSEDPPANPLAAMSSADQLATVRYGLMAQRVVAYCAANEPGQDAALLHMYGGAGELQKSFTPAELAVLRPRCPALLAQLRKS